MVLAAPPATRLERPAGNKWDGFCIYGCVIPYNHETEEETEEAANYGGGLYEIAEHGRPVSMRSALHKSKKVYDRKRLKKAGITSDDLPLKSK